MNILDLFDFDNCMCVCVRKCMLIGFWYCAMWVGQQSAVNSQQSTVDVIWVLGVMSLKLELGGYHCAVLWFQWVWSSSGCQCWTLQWLVV